MSCQPVITNFELSNNNNNNTGWLKNNVYIQQKLLRAIMNYVEFEKWFEYDKSIFELHHYFGIHYIVSDSFNYCILYLYLI